MVEPLSVVVLAAGQGTRMRNGLAKVLHPLAGRSLIGHVLATATALEPEQLTVVLAPGMDAVRAEVERVATSARIAIQDRPLGTGHALAAAGALLPKSGCVLVLYGDTPLLRTATLQSLVEAVSSDRASVAVLGMRPPDPAGYGRLRFDADRLVELVEERHADPTLCRDGICNSGVMAFEAAILPDLLDAMPLRPEKNEYYLTDTVALAHARGLRCTAREAFWVEGLGVNSQRQLGDAEREMQERLRSSLLDGGVVMLAPDTVHLAFDSRVEAGAVIEPYVVMAPGVRVRSGAVIRSFSHLEGATVESGAQIGPFARLRPGTHVGPGARVGNFVEVKNTQVADGVKINHLSYIGDAEIGREANIGAGTITCNYDGFDKHRTAIGAHAFIGSNSALVAPVEIGEGAIVGAGSTITQDVPADGMAIARARQTNHGGRARDWRATKSTTAAIRRS